MTRLRAAVLASGGGTNLQALLDYLRCLGESRALDVVLVASDREDAGALERARRAGIATAVVRSKRHPEAPELLDVLAAHDVGLVVLAGYLRLVPAAVIERYASRIVNVHPGPLPRFGGEGMYGQRVHRAVLEAGADATGPTVHLVDEIFDHGAPLAHWPVPVLAGDDEHVLAARVLRAEHLLFPRVVQQLAQRIGSAEGGAIPDAGAPLVLPPFDPRMDDAALARLLDRSTFGASQPR